MRRSLVLGVVAALAWTGFSQESFKAGEGVANDHSANVSFVARGGGNPYGYGVGSQYATPLGLTLLGWSLPNAFSVVDGIRLNFGCGRFERTNGIDVGLWSTSGDFRGVAANLIGNFSERDSVGLQVGLVNLTEFEVDGVQIGLVNKAGHLRGVQIGLVNFNPSGISFPILNCGF